MLEIIIVKLVSIIGSLHNFWLKKNNLECVFSTKEYRPFQLCLNHCESEHWQNFPPFN